MEADGTFGALVRVVVVSVRVTRASVPLGARRLETVVSIRPSSVVSSVRTALAIVAALGTEGALVRVSTTPPVIVRPVAGYGMPDHLRVTIGTQQENALFLKALAGALQS